jgi:hypothetical protein
MKGREDEYLLRLKKHKMRARTVEAGPDRSLSEAKCFSAPF